MKLNKTYAILTLLLFIIEVFIGIYMHDDLIRPFGGDLLVVILIYYFTKSVVDISMLNAAVGTLIFSYIVEISQYFNLLKHLGLQNSKLAAILLGQSFSWGGYTLLYRRHIYSNSSRTILQSGQKQLIKS